MTKYLSPNRPCAQGDIILIPIQDIPPTAHPAIPEHNKFIIAHSETGHHHTVERPKAEVYEAANNAFVAYIQTLADPVPLTHERQFDTHETIVLPPNSKYEIRRQREYVPEGFRKAAD